MEAAPVAPIEIRICVPPVESVKVQIEQRIRASLAGTPIEKISPAIVSCLWRVQAENGTVMYADWTGRYLIQGVVLDLKTGQMLETKTTGISNE